MQLSVKSVFEYINFFVRNIIGFEKEEIKYTTLNDSGNEYLLIAMDRIARLERDHGQLRKRIWNNVCFIFSENRFFADYQRKEKVLDLKRKLPHLFIRSYVYFVFIDYSRLVDESYGIDTSDFRILLFNSKYEVRELTNRRNIFNVSLNIDEKIDDYMYIANSEFELNRLKSANSDAIDCVRAFTGELTLLEQTVNMFTKVTEELDKNESAHIILEGPARSGKTIIAASLLGKYPQSKFLLMNAFFYQAIVDGFYALSNFSFEEIETMVRNPDLDKLLILQKEIPGNLNRITNSLEVIIKENSSVKVISNQKKNIVKAINDLMKYFNNSTIDVESLRFIKVLDFLKREVQENKNNEPFSDTNIKEFNRISSIIKNRKSIELGDLIPDTLENILKCLDIIIERKDSINDINESVHTLINETKNIFEKIPNFMDYNFLVYLNELKEYAITSFEVDNIIDDFDIDRFIKARETIMKILNKDFSEILAYEKIIAKSINAVIENSKQRFFHHNIDKSLPDQIVKGCWIDYGNSTKSRMWTEDFSPKLIICDEVQRLGIIPGGFDRKEFDEIGQLLSHSKQTFFTGDNYQMLNSKYDKGILEISEKLLEKRQRLTRYRLPESIGIPAEIELLMKYISNITNIDIFEIAKCFEHEKNYTILILKQNQDLLVNLFDKDYSNKKHFASPIDGKWFDKIENREIITKNKSRQIKALFTKGKNFAYTFPYFCNEEIMPNYYLSAYELISRELDSLYVNIPKFKSILNEDETKWFKNHLYVLFTRPTSKLVLNFEDLNDYKEIQKKVSQILEVGVKIPIRFEPIIAN